jgi:hypothetical protein
MNPDVESVRKTGADAWGVVTSRDAATGAFAVLLDDGRLALAHWPKRRLGCLFGSLDGRRARISIRSRPNRPGVILELRAK